MSNALSPSHETLYQLILQVSQQNATVLGLPLNVPSLAQYLHQTLPQMLQYNTLYLGGMWTALQQQNTLSHEQLSAIYRDLPNHLASAGFQADWSMPPTNAPPAAFQGLYDPDVGTSIQESNIHQIVLGLLMESFVDAGLSQHVDLDTLGSILMDTIDQCILPDRLDLEELWTALMEVPNVTPATLRPAFLSIAGKESLCPLPISIPDQAFYEGRGETMITSNNYKDAMILILRCIEETPLNEILDPERMKEFLGEELKVMWQNRAFDLEELWAILLEAPGVNEEMLLQMFVLLDHRRSALPIEIRMPREVEKLSRQKKAQMLNVLLGAKDAPAAKASSVEVLQALQEKLAAKANPTGRSGQGVGGDKSKSAPARPVMVSALKNPPKPSDKVTTPPKDKVTTPPKDKEPPKSKDKEPPKSKDKEPPKSKDKEPPKSKDKAKKPGTPRKTSPLIYIALVVSLAGAGGLYFFFLHKPTPVLRGSLLPDITEYRSKLPDIIDIRHEGAQVFIRVNNSFLSRPQTMRDEQLYSLFTSCQAKLRIRRMFLFDQTNKLLKELGS